MNAHAHIKFGVVSRGKTSERATGGNAVAMSAYQACAKFEHDGRVFDFTRKAKEKAAETAVYLPSGAPSWASDAAELARRMEAAEHQRNSQTGRWVVISIPREVREEDYPAYAAAVAVPLTVEGMAAQADCHKSPASDGGENPHVHLLATMRRFDGAEFNKKKAREWNDLFRSDDGRVMRRRFAAAANGWLEANGYDARLDPEKWNDGVEPERDVSRAAVEIAKKTPGVAKVYREVRFRRQERRRLRKELSELRQAEVEIAALELEYEHARTIETERPKPDPNSVVDALEYESGEDGYSADPQPSERTAAEGRRRQDRPDLAEPRPDHGKPDGDASQARRTRSEDVNRSRSARRARERAEFRSRASRPGDERLRSARQRMRDVQPPGIALGNQEARRLRRESFMACLLRQAYSPDQWVSDETVANLARIELDRDLGRVTLHLRGGGRIIDTGDQLRLVGAPRDVAVTELLALVDRHDWQSVAIDGDPDFRQRVAAELLGRRPPVQVMGLTDDDRRAVDAELVRRNALRRAEALCILRGLEQRAEIHFEADPSPTTTGHLIKARDAVAAAADGNVAVIDAALKRDSKGLSAAVATWRQQRTAASAIVDDVVFEAVPVQAPAPAYRPQWTTPPQKDRHDTRQ